MWTSGDSERVAIVARKGKLGKRGQEREPRNEKTRREKEKGAESGQCRFIRETNSSAENSSDCID